MKLSSTMYIILDKKPNFVSSEVDEKHQLINLVLQNVKLDGKNVVWDIQNYLIYW